MKTLLLEIKSSLLCTLVFALLLCGAYPLAVWGGARLLFHDKADGSLVLDRDGTLRGSLLLAQNFASEKYFHPRPSAAGQGFDATASSGTNLGPTSSKLADSIRAAVAAYRAENHLAADVAVPADAVTSSASGLDPHISAANAELQAERVAQARKMPVAAVRALITGATDDRNWGLLGEPGVNVLRLNLALEK